VLLLNHVLMQEPQAQERLVRHKGRCVRMQWRDFTLPFVATPAGLLEIAATGRAATGPVAHGDAGVSHGPRSVCPAWRAPDRSHVEGDVQLAADVNWLVDHLRWDIEEDISRVIGDAPAHALGQAAREAARVLQQFARGRPRPHGDRAAA
jgi:ubiquinone biosynthesis protein UbiJ